MSSLQPDRQMSARQLWTFAFLVLLLLATTACGPEAANPTATVVQPSGTPSNLPSTATAPPNDHYPILMITGFGGLPFGKEFECRPLENGRLTEAAKTPTIAPAENPEATFGDFANTLRNHGYQVTAIPIISTPCYSARIKDDIPVVATAVADLKAKAQSDKVIIIAHSTGGVAARAYLETAVNGKLPDDVSDLFTFGAPHEGITIDTNMLAILFFVADRYGGEVWQDYVTRQELFQDFDPRGMEEYNRSLTPNPNVRYHYFAGRAGPDERNALADVLNVLYLNADNDGLISVRSASFTNRNIPGTVAKDTHSGDFGKPSYFLVDSPIHNPLLTAIADSESRPAGTPTATRAPTEAPEPNADIPICEAEYFVGLVDKLGIGSAMAPAVAQYALDCEEQGHRLPIENLVLAANSLDPGYRIQYSSVDSADAVLSVTETDTAFGRVTGFLPDTLTPVIRIPDSHAVQLSGRTYIVYADAEVTPNFVSRTTQPFEIEVFMSTGNRAGQVQRVPVLPRMDRDRGYINLSEVERGGDPTVHLDPGGIEPEVLQTPEVEVIPLRPIDDTREP